MTNQKICEQNSAAFSVRDFISPAWNFLCEGCLVISAYSLFQRLNPLEEKHLRPLDFLTIIVKNARGLFNYSSEYFSHIGQLITV